MKQRDVEISLSCRILEVSRSGYYEWRVQEESVREGANVVSLEEIRRCHQESRGTYGSPQVTAQLRGEGHGCSENRVARLMRKAGIRGAAKKRFRVKTTDSNHALPIAERLFQAENPATHPKGPHELWASDITYIPTEEGWLYLTIFLDVFTRKVVGWSMGDSMKVDWVLKALEAALLRERPDGERLLTHSDRGSQYAAEAFCKRLNELGIRASMSRRGNCYDNAYAESFFHSLKVELIHRSRFKSRKEAQSAIFEYIETWYNPKRLHSSLGYRSPNDYEKLHLAA